MSSIQHLKSLPFISIMTLFIFFSTTIFAKSEKSPWQGPYIGGYFGGSWWDNHLSTSAGTVTDTSYFTTPMDIRALEGVGSSTDKPVSNIAGMTLGHDWEHKKMIYGIVVDYGVLSMNSSASDSQNYVDNAGAYHINTSISTNWLLTLRGRLGYQINSSWPSLLYATGGMAMTQLKVKNHFNDNLSYEGSGSSQTSGNQIGWTIGVGIELAKWQHLTLGAEYLYIQVPSLETRTQVANSAGGFGIPPNSLTSPFETTGNFHANLIKIGLNYRFDESIGLITRE